MMNIRRTSGNEGLRRAAESCLRAVGKFHSALSFGFLWIFRKIGALLARIPWNFRASLGALAAALILLVAVSYGTELLLLSGFTEIVPETPAQAEESAAKAPERVNPDDEFSETKLTADVPGARERFAPLGQLKALREADPATVNPDRREMKPEETAEAYERRFSKTGLNKSNLFYTDVQLDALYRADAFRGLDLFRKAGWILLFLLLAGGILGIVSYFLRPAGKAAWYLLAAGCTGFGLYWLCLIIPMFSLPDTLLAMNRPDFDTTMRDLIWFSYLWLWMPVLALSFFFWFPLYLSRARAAFGFGKRRVETADRWEKNLTCRGTNPGIYRGTYWAFTYHFVILLVLPLLMRGCYQIDSYEIPQGDGGGAVEVVVKRVKPKPKKTKRWVLNPNSAILFEIPKMEDTLSEELDEQTVAEVYQTTQMNMGQGRKGGKAGWPDGMAGGRIRFIRLEYRGGDWDQDMGKGSDYNMLLKMKEYAGFNIADDTEAVSIDRLSRWKQGKAPPFVYLTGSGRILVNASEAKEIRRYLLETGGMLFADNGGGVFDSSFRNLLRQILPELQLIDIANDDPIYQSPFAFPDGAPPLFHHSGSRALGLKYNGRWIVFYHQGDINDAWKTGGSGISEDKRELAFKMGANVIAYAFTQYLAQIRKNRVQQ